MKHVIIVNGPARAGKDTAIEFMRASLKRRGYVSQEFSSIDPIRNKMAFFDIDVSKKTPADRKLLATIGDALQEHSEYRTQACLQETNNFFAWNDKSMVIANGAVMFIHIREPVLIALLKQKLDLLNTGQIVVSTVYVMGRPVPNHFSNKADAGTGDMEYEFEILNTSSLGHLLDECDLVLNQILDDGEL